MNLILQAAIIIWFLCIVPFAVGLLLEKTVIKENISLAECMTLGLLSLCSLFMMASVPLIQLKQTLRLLEIVWFVVTMLFVIVSFIYSRSEIKDLFVKSKIEIKERNKIFYITVAICLLSIVIAVLFIQPDNSGNVVEITNRAVATDSLYGYDAYTGEAVAEVDASLKYSPFEMYYAVLAGISGIHPAILIKLVIPIVWIPIVYGTYYMWGKLVYSTDEKKQCMFVLACVFLSVYPVISGKGYGLWVLNGIWQRDAFLCSFILPVALWTCVKLLCRKNRFKVTLLELLLCSVAAEFAVYKSFYYIVLMVFVTMILWIYRRCNRCRNA